MRSSASVLLACGALLAACGEPLAPARSPAVIASFAIATAPNEPDAVALSQIIQERHWPYLTLLNPRFATGDSTSPSFMTLAPSGYTQAADNAIWTGHYLAAEALRYQVTGSPDALANATKALRGITALIDVTGTNLLARFLIPRSSPYAQAVLDEEVQHGIHYSLYNGEEYG